MDRAVYLFVQGEQRARVILHAWRPHGAAGQQLRVRGRWLWRAAGGHDRLRALRVWFELLVDLRDDLALLDIHIPEVSFVLLGAIHYLVSLLDDEYFCALLLRDEPLVYLLQLVDGLIVQRCVIVGAVHGLPHQLVDVKGVSFLVAALLHQIYLLVAGLVDLVGG